MYFAQFTALMHAALASDLFPVTTKNARTASPTYFRT
jgi:hypothetical protein